MCNRHLVEMDPEFCARDGSEARVVSKGRCHIYKSFKAAQDMIAGKKYYSLSIASLVDTNLL